MDEPDASALTVPKPQFRTYASDVAKLSGRPLSKTSTSTPAPEPTKPVEPAPPPPAQIIPKAPTTDESREAVLERLRAKAEKREVPAPPEAKPVPPAPSTNESREAVLARLKAKASGPVQVPVPAPAPHPTPPPGLPPVSRPVPTQTPSPIHTYKSDFSDRAKAENASPISILAVEQNARGAQPTPQQLKPLQKNYTPFVIGALVLILAGGASMYFAVSFVTGRPPILISPSVPSLIFADEHRELQGTGAELVQGLADLSNTNMREGGVAIAYVTYASTTEKGVTIMLPAEGGALISALGLGAPDILLRNVEPSSTVGAIKASGETYPFFIFRVASFERTFAGMLEWENSMERDLARLYPSYPEVVPEETVSASSTPLTETAFRVSFVDDVVENHDVRVLRDAQNRALILYGYRDKQTLIIARNELAFKELLARLSSTRSN